MDQVCLLCRPTCVYLSINVGGHYNTSNCLCDHPLQRHTPSQCYTNALRDSPFNEALVAEEHISEYQAGLQNWRVGQRVYILRAAPDESTALWRKGRMGGWATILEWKRCGGRQPCWHGARILEDVPWKVYLIIILHIYHIDNIRLFIG
jgi:hypothetical protein